MKIYLLSDLFSEEVVGGAEICNDAIVKYLNDKNITVEKVRTSQINPSFLESKKDDNFLIANFFMLSEPSKEYFIKHFYNKYVIIEHDHKYVSTNNPSLFVDMNIDEQFIVNKQFYKNAKAVLAQSKIHADTISKNLLLNNVINLQGNCWTNEQLFVLKNNMFNEKTIEYAIMYSNNKNKGMNRSIEYCISKNINYEFIPLKKYENFIEHLSHVKNLIFFPQWLETFSRVSVEAKILGCKLITNKLIGAASEDFFHNTPKNIIDYIEEQSKKIPEIVYNLFCNNLVEFYERKNIPKVSIITSLYNSEKYLESYLENITKQTIFDSCELLLINVDKSKKEDDLINRYLNKYKNIKYYKLDTDPGIYGVWNYGIKLSSGDYICNSNVDDLRTYDSLEILSKHLTNEKDIDLVYGDCIETSELPNLNNLSLSYKKYEHSINDFSNENMIKCLPGPLPMWKKQLHEKFGYFNEKYNSAGDWEMWLRAVEGGSTFKKINFIAGMYYNNPSGKSTSLENFNKKFLEEKEIFFKYKNLFPDNYKKYFDWFNK